MVDTSNSNGDGARMRAIANSVTLQAMSRIAMAIGTPFVAAVLTAGAWFIEDLASETREARKAFMAFQLTSMVDSTEIKGKLGKLEWRADTTDREISGLREYVYHDRRVAPPP